MLYHRDMYHTPDRPRQFYAPSVDEDEVHVARGCGIPQGYPKTDNRHDSKPVVEIRVNEMVRPLVAYKTSIVAAILFLGVGFFAWQGFTVAETSSQVATPTVVLEHTTVGDLQPFQYGKEPLLAKPSFFAHTYEAFVSAQATFIKADLEAMSLVYYRAGEPLAEYPIKAKGRPGSWWETPAGLYKVQDKRPRHRSSFAGVDLPWSMPFQGNFFIHGIPEYPDGTPVKQSFSGGCIRLNTDDAEELYHLVETGTPILVFARSNATTDTFQYEPNIPDMDAPHYLVADIGNNTILASSELHQQVSIASITKLMTALVASEYINLDQRVRVGSAGFVQSIVPRLADRQSVSMYSLLQLLLIESSNEAADLIADQLGREVFIARMNEKANAIGMNDTTFTDPSGLDADNVSTLNDLLRLIQYLYNNRSFILELTADQYVATAYDADAFGELNNFNLLSDLEDFYGGKTGETNAAGQTSISLHRFMVRGEERLIAIAVLGSTDRTRDALRLHTYFQERFAR